MNKRNQIVTLYSNSRECIKKGDSKKARAYLLLILNLAVESYYQSKSILEKAKTAVFLDQWIAVSKELYSVGITDYVLECYNLKDAQNVVSSSNENLPKNGKEEEETLEEKEIDYRGLISEPSNQKDWGIEVFEKNKNSVVEIIIEQNGTKISGTGFIISKRGYFLTNDHVVFDEEKQRYYSKIKMLLVEGKKNCKVDVLFTDKKADVALCKFDVNELNDFKAINISNNQSSIVQGAECLVIGNAFGLGIAPSFGRIRYSQNQEGDIVHTAPTNPGDSGGPIFNRYGECIGINKSKTTFVNGFSADAYANATSTSVINQLLNKWASNNDFKL